MAELLTALRSGGRRASRRMRSEEGFGIPTAVMVVLIVFALGATWSRLGVHSMQLSAHDRGREQALNVAEAGINDAMSQLTVDLGWSGTSGTLPDGIGDFEVAVAPMSSDPNDLRRLVTATGYVPSKDDPSPVVRKLQAEVDLVEVDGFRYGLFAGVFHIDGENHMTVNGDVYGQDGVELENNTDVHGNVVSPMWVTTANNTLITGDIRAGGDVTLDASSTTVQGNVYSGGNVIVNARVMGNVQAAGTITVTNNGSVGGSLAPSSPPPPVRVEQLPTFTWDAGNYSPAPTTWSSAANWATDWQTKAIAGIPYSGHYRITDTASVTLDRKWTMDGDVTIVSDGPIVLSRDVTNATSETLDLVIVSLAEGGITMTNSITVPDSIRLLLFAPNGPVDFRNLKHFSGVVYGESIEVDQNFTLTYDPPDAPGFSWSAATDVHYQVVQRVLREVSALGGGS